MRFSSHAALGLLAATASNALPSPSPQDDVIAPSGNDVDTLAQLGLQAQETTNATLQKEKRAPGSCTLKTLSVRREWYVGFYNTKYHATHSWPRGALSKSERKNYTDAVLCLQEKQSKTPSSLIPGAKSRFDDWVGTHINQTTTIHYTVSLTAFYPSLVSVISAPV